MLLQQRGTNGREQSLYGGERAIGVEWYFIRQSVLGATVVRYDIPPGSSEGEHLHLAGSHDSCTPDSADELYVVTRGELTVTVDGESAVLHAGDAVYAPAGSTHGVSNGSSESAELIMVFGPPSASPDGRTPESGGGQA